VSRLPPPALTAMAAAAGAAIALSVAAATGMPRHELVELGLMLGPGLFLIVLIAWAVMREEARRRERSVEAQRRDLVIAVSHDLRTPLSSMRAIAEAIDEKVVGDPATLQRYAAEMRRSAEALTTLVDDLFELVQLESGAISLGTERASLSEVVGAAVAACDGQAVEKGLRHTPAEGTVRSRRDGFAGRWRWRSRTPARASRRRTSSGYSSPSGEVTRRARTKARASDSR
jgi:signal transduction histidine kinase